MGLRPSMARLVRLPNLSAAERVSLIPAPSNPVIPSVHQADLSSAVRSHRKLCTGPSSVHWLVLPSVSLLP